MSNVRAPGAISPVTAFAAGRAAYGVILLAAPGRLLAGAGATASRRQRQVARLLGARHIVQAAAMARAGRPMLAVGAVADGLHAASMAAVAVADARARRAALADAAVASLLTCLGAALRSYPSGGR